MQEGVTCYNCKVVVKKRPVEATIEICDFFERPFLRKENFVCYPCYLKVYRFRLKLECCVEGCKEHNNAKDQTIVKRRLPNGSQHLFQFKKQFSKKVHSSFVCETHYRNSFRLLAKEQQQSTAPTLTITNSSPNLGNQKRGRDYKYSDYERIKAAFLVAKGVSLSSVGEIIAIASSHSISDFKNTSQISRGSAFKFLIEAQQSLLCFVAEKLQILTELNLGIDSTSDRTQRELISITFGGFEKEKEKKWNFPVAVFETINHTAKTQVEAISSILLHLNSFQKEPKTKLLNFVSITFDNTSSNRGKNGVLGELEKIRRVEWENGDRESPYLPLVDKGCEDHISNLISNEFEKRLIKQMECWDSLQYLSKGKKHISTYAIIHVCKRLTGSPYRRPFRAFIAAYGEKPFKFIRISETRFCTIDILSSIIYKYFGFIVLFLTKCFSLLTEIDKRVLIALFNVDVLAIIQVRALMATRILLPLMKEANTIFLTQEYKLFLEKWTTQVKYLLQQPEEAFRISLSTIDTKVLAQVSTAKNYFLQLKSSPNAVLNATVSEIVDDDICELDIEVDEPRQKNSKTENLGDFLLSNVKHDEIGMENKDEDEDEDEDEQDGNMFEELSEKLDLITPTDHAKSTITLLDLSPPKFKEPPPSFNQRKITYLEHAMKSFLFMQEKHNNNIIHQKVEIAIFNTTSRKLERTFSISKTLMDDNPNVRSLAMHAIMIIREFSFEEVEEIYNRYTNQGINFKDIAKNLIHNSARKKDIDQAHLQSLMEEVEKQKKIQESKTFKSKISEELQKKGIEIKNSILKSHLMKYLELIGHPQDQKVSKEKLLEIVAQKLENEKLILS